MRDSERRLAFGMWIWLACALAGSFLGKTELAIYTALVCATLFGISSELVRAYRTHSDRDGHRMAETVSGSVHDQPGPEASPNGGLPPHSAE